MLWINCGLLWCFYHSDSTHSCACVCLGSSGWHRAEGIAGTRGIQRASGQLSHLCIADLKMLKCTWNSFVWLSSLMHDFIQTGSRWKRRVWTFWAQRTQGTCAIRTHIYWKIWEIVREIASEYLLFSISIFCFPGNKLCFLIIWNILWFILQQHQAQETWAKRKHSFVENTVTCFLSFVYVYGYSTNRIKLLLGKHWILWPPWFAGVLKLVKHLLQLIIMCFM